MEGGYVEQKEYMKLGNIGDYKELADLTYVAAASVVSLDAVLALNKFGGVGGTTLNSFFDTLGLEAVVVIVVLVVVLFEVARFAYSFYTSGGKVWSPLVFVAILLGVQMVHDLIFYVGVVSNVPSGKNQVIDFLKRYGKENGARALGASATFMIVVATLAMLYKEFSPVLLFGIVGVAVYALPYLMNTAGPMPPPPPPPKEKAEKQEQKVDPYSMMAGRW
jgi:hypothetical protein